MSWENLKYFNTKLSYSHNHGNGQNTVRSMSTKYKLITPSMIVQMITVYSIRANRAVVKQNMTQKVQVNYYTYSSF